MLVCQISKAWQPPVCRNCKYFMPNDKAHSRLKHGYCLRLPSYDKVTGEPTFKYAKEERTKGTCTELGFYYEAEHPFKVMLKDINWEDIKYKLMWTFLVFMWLTTMLASYILSKKTF